MTPGEHQLGWGWLGVSSRRVRVVCAMWGRDPFCGRSGVCCAVTQCPVQVGWMWLCRHGGSHVSSRPLSPERARPAFAGWQLCISVLGAVFPQIHHTAEQRVFCALGASHARVRKCKFIFAVHSHHQRCNELIGPACSPGALEVSQGCLRGFQLPLDVLSALLSSSTATGTVGSGQKVLNQGYWSPPRILSCFVSCPAG